MSTRHRGTKAERDLSAGAAGAAAALSVVPRSVLAGGGGQPPSDRLNIAGVGLGAMGTENLENCGGENVAALCDVDGHRAADAFKRWPKAARYRDYRRMLDREKGIDAVVVATPDHTHAVITAEAMKRGKHVYTQMPLAHDVWEARQLARIARETGVTTQMGNERHSGPSIRRVCEWIWDGAIGPVREVYCWTDRPNWPQGPIRAGGGSAAPSSLEWDLWIGPAPERRYHPAYHPYRWRGWRDFGTGALGAMGCHVLDAPFWALRLGEASGFNVHASSTEMGEGTYPAASVVHYRFPARGEMPPVAVHWYDGGLKPPRPPELPELRGLGSNGAIFVGDEGRMAFGALTAGTFPGQAGPRLMPESRMRSYRRPSKSIPRVESGSGWRSGDRHEQEWIGACKEGVQPCASFDCSGPLTEMVLLGNVALLAGGCVEWDAAGMKDANRPAEVAGYVRRGYRQGWSL